MKAEQVNYPVGSFGRFRSNQGAIWEEISEKAARREAESPSMATSSIYEKDIGILHLSLFARSEQQNNERHTSRMRRFTQRRRNWVY